MIKKLPSQLINQALLFCLGVSSLLFITNLQSNKLKKISETTWNQDEYFQKEKIEELKLSTYKKMPSFGFKNLIADWTMLQFLQYFGDGKARNNTGYSLSADYLEVISKNDPKFSLAYLIISPASSMFAGTPGRTVELMDQGLKYLTPNLTKAHFVWLYKGMDEILFLGDLEKARKSYIQASEWASIAGDEFIAQSASDTAKFLETKPDIRSTQISVWFLVWNNNKDERVRKIARAKIESIGGEIKIYPNGRAELIQPKVNNS